MPPAVKTGTAASPAYAQVRAAPVKSPESCVLTVPSKPDGLYVLTSSNGKKYFFGVINDKFVVATDAARAGEYASQSATSVPGAHGSLTMAVDTRSVANEVARQQGQSAAALFTNALGDFVGSVESATDGLNGQFKLNIK